MSDRCDCESCTAFRNLMLAKQAAEKNDQLHSALVLLKAVDHGNGQHQTAEWQQSFREWSDRNFPADKEE